jgi:GNAT superfamily N-acetyltransferase
MKIKIRAIEPKDRQAIHKVLEDLWGGAVVVAHLELFDCDHLPGFAAFLEGQLAGFLHYQITKQDCEILTLAALLENQGVGSALLAKMEEHARRAGCPKLHLVTTNDNRHALTFYQHRGYRIAAVFPGRIIEARKLKPTLPLRGENGIPIEDEILLEKGL